MESTMRKSFRGVAGIAAVLLGAGLAGCASGSVATVNGTPISTAAFDQKLEAMPTAKGVLQQMVVGELLTQYAAKNNITVSADDIKKKEDAIKANFPNGSWDTMLKARGLTEDQVHDALKQQIIIDKAVGKNVNVTDTQIKQYFDKNHAQFDTPLQIQTRHILLSDMATALKVEGLLKQGQKFSALAQQYSNDPGSKAKGGELGFNTQSQLVAPYWNAAASQKVGVAGPPVKSPFGYHIIEVEARKPAVKATLANTHDKIADLLRQQEEQPLIQPFIQGLQTSAKINVTDPRFADVFPSPPPSMAPAATTAPATPAATTKP